MDIYIVILHYGNLVVTQKCIESLAEHDKDFKKIVLINNDGDIKLSASQFTISSKKIHIVNNKGNVGFASGVNIGIKYALAQNAKCVLLLNNDTVSKKDFLKKLAAVLETNQEIGIVGPAIAFHKEGKTLYDLGGKVNEVIGRTQHDEVEKITDASLRIVTYVSGCCMLIKQEVFEKIGFFDEQFFLYSEDVDFSLRARDAGFLSAVLPSVTIYHELSKAAGKISPFSVYHQTKSGVIFGKKHSKAFLLNILFLLAQSSWIFMKKRDAGIAAFNGLKNGLANT